MKDEWTDGYESAERDLSWQGEVLSMVHESLRAHLGDEVDATPPMMYPEAIAAVYRKGIQRGKELAVPAVPDPGYEVGIKWGALFRGLMRRKGSADG